jgi:hypothetical protein
MISYARADPASALTTIITVMKALIIESLVPSPWS